jgi:hypothetical protein
MTTNAERRFPGKTPHEIADIMIDNWHELPDCDIPLHSYLGMSQEQYARYVEENVLPQNWERRV